MSRRTTTRQIAESLGETAPRPLAQIEQIVDALGETASLGLLAQTERIETAGGMPLPYGKGRRTPGGVFFQLAQKQLSPELRNAIFPARVATSRSPETAAPRSSAS